MKIFCNTMLYIIFQYGVEPVLIQRIIIGFEAILENGLSIDKSKAFIIGVDPSVCGKLSLKRCFT